MNKAISVLRKPSGFRSSYENWKHRRRTIQFAKKIAENSTPDPQQSPVVFFNASARLGSFSQNAAFSLLTSWGLRLAGTPIIHFVCQAGLSPCVLGTNREDITTPPPCNSCLALSTEIYSHSNVRFFNYRPDTDLALKLENLTVEESCDFEYQSRIPYIPAIPIGKLVLPSARWALRRHHLEDNPQNRYLLKQYILSAKSVIDQFNQLIDEVQPSATVIFNGIMYPEASTRWIAQARGIKVLTHEVGFQRFSAFFSQGDATAYPIDIQEDFELSDEQNKRLDIYLEQRFQGKFTMAGIRFWPEMHGLDENFHQKASTFRQIVPVFTNVVYDTSQVHANVVFPHMFAWLDMILELIRIHPNTLFVIRAHPDEMRPGTFKQSRETVEDWVRRNKVNEFPNVVFIQSQEYISSYELIQRAKFIMVYNSSIGLEAALMGKPVLCAGKARYTQYPIVWFPENQEAFRLQAQAFLKDEQSEFPPEYQNNARRFLYYQLYLASLSFEDYLETGSRAGFVHLKSFDWRHLLPQNSQTIDTIIKGILEEKPFLLTEDVTK